MTTPGPWPHHNPSPPSGVGMPSAIAVTTKSVAVAAMAGLFFFRPRIFLNGYEIARTWGRNVILVPPGVHQLHIHIFYRMYGGAKLTVPVQPGRTAELEYAVPAWAFLAGSLGPGPQRHRGLRVVLVWWVLVLVGWVVVGVLVVASLT